MVQFRAGCYRMDIGFIRSIERRSGEEGNWGKPMLLVNMNRPSENSEETALFAKMDIDTAQKRALASGGSSTIDHELVILGYNVLEE